MFDARYRRAVNDAHHRLAATVGPIGDRITALLDAHPVRTGPYPLEVVLAQLAQHQVELSAAVAAYPLPLAVNAEHRPDRLGGEIAGLASSLALVLVYYGNLTDIPAVLRSVVTRDLGELARDARIVTASASAG
jgi:hypothetical protein